MTPNEETVLRRKIEAVLSEYGIAEFQLYDRAPSRFGVWRMAQGTPKLVREGLDREAAHAMVRRFQSMAVAHLFKQIEDEAAAAKGDPA